MKVSLLLLTLVSLLLLAKSQISVNPHDVVTLPIIRTTKTTPKPQSPYCQPKLCPKGQHHVACENYYKSLHGACPAKQIHFVNLTDLAETIIKQHNQRRYLLASGKDSKLPRAARMVAMQWDEELAAVAGFNVRMCQPMHDDCRNTVKYPRSGQNIIVFNMTHHVEKKVMEQLYQELMSIAVNTWWSEAENMTAANMELFPCDEKRQKAYRHFAVMAVEGNSHVGCAGLLYVVKNLTQFKLTCNYARAPVCGQPIYRFQPVGCQTGRNKKHSSLCSPTELFH
ncbi:antigen 5 like allergen Cul n 1-like [Drosophila eugracilis]|uniref:antigen 5 like allergen Cul n 1-like n=1 Tax=Drosophila eugracilis TaxID=29029 RepID=UPI0007E682BC|nr:antigen 5 like allergen Cul n 1-like [Drosophila eugracilis]